MARTGHAGMQAPIQLEDEAIAVDNRGVALLGVHDARFQLVARRLVPAQVAGAIADDLPGHALNAATARDHVEEGVTDGGINECVEQQPLGAAPCGAASRISAPSVMSAADISSR